MAPVGGGHAGPSAHRSCLPPPQPQAHTYNPRLIASSRHHFHLSQCKLRHRIIIMHKMAHTCASPPPHTHTHTHIVQPFPPHTHHTNTRMHTRVLGPSPPHLMANSSSSPSPPLPPPLPPSTACCLPWQGGQPCPAPRRLRRTISTTATARMITAEGHCRESRGVRQGSRWCVGAVVKNTC